MLNKFKNIIRKMINASFAPHEMDVKQCVKDSSQECPSRTLVHSGGRLESVGLTSCCKFFDQMKSFDKSIGSLEPNKNYNGTKFSKSVVESSKRSYDNIKNIEYVGPICDDNKRIIND
jgi:hypothetical protein